MLILDQEEMKFIALSSGARDIRSPPFVNRAMRSLAKAALDCWSSLLVGNGAAICVEDTWKPYHQRALMSRNAR